METHFQFSFGLIIIDYIMLLQKLRWKKEGVLRKKGRKQRGSCTVFLELQVRNAWNRFSKHLKIINIFITFCVCSMLFKVFKLNSSCWPHLKHEKSRLNKRQNILNKLIKVLNESHELKSVLSGSRSFPQSLHGIGH